MLKVFLYFFIVVSAFADDKPLISDAAALIYENDFSGKDFKSPFKKPAKGDWTFPGQYMDYKEKPDDNHPGVLKFDKVEGDFIVEMEIRFPKDKRGDKFMAGLVINAKGHLGRVNISNKGFSTQKDKSEEKDFVKWEKTLNLEQWYTFRFECIKDTFICGFNGTIVSVSHKEIENSPVKTICITGSNKAQFRHFKVHKATAKKDFKSILTKLKKTP